MRYRLCACLAEKNMNEQLFEAIYDQYADMIFRTAFLLTGSQFDAEDLTQETFVMAMEHVHELRDTSRLKAWLFRIMTNLARKKRKTSLRESSNEHVTELADSQQIGTPSTENDLNAMPERIDMLNYLQQIPPKQREAVVLYYYNDMSVNEIARACGCLPGTVKSRLSNGRSRLRKIMERESLI